MQTNDLSKLKSTANPAATGHAPTVPGRDKLAPCLSILDEAKRTIQTRGSYGSPQENLDRTAGLINAVLVDKLAHPISAADVTLIMTAVKMARLIETPDHRDSQVDIAGWISLLGEVA
jgi:hypothetical protein|tara:strand:+ start:1615 stop:1968 length:354 start_codon:yes stop_codon:yes gene_type:complete